MTTVGICMARDEAEIIGYTVAHMLTQVDHVIVADNLSADKTAKVAASAGAWVLEDNDPAYRQSEKMTHLASVAADSLHATWIVPFDADEFWYSPEGRLGTALDSLAPQWLTATATLYDHVPTAVDGTDPHPARRITWRRDYPGALPKVACRWRDDLVINMGNHSATYQGGTTTYPNLVELRHFQYRSAEHMIRKVRNGVAALRAAPEIPPEMGQHWRDYAGILESENGEEKLADVFRTWFWSADPVNDGLVNDPAPLP